MTGNELNHNLTHRLLRLGRMISPAWMSAIGVLLITVIALFVRPFIGMADNGDYFRILYSNGLYFNVPDYDSHYLGYFVKDYGIFQYYNENGATLSSSQSLFIRLAIWVNTWLYHNERFDIRFQAAIFTVLYVIAIYLLVESLTWRIAKKYGYSIAAIAIFVFADTGYTAYFNSFYSESIVLISLLFLFAAGLLLYRRRYNDYLLLAIFAISGLLLITSKQQNAPVGVIIALTLFILIYIRKERPFRALMASSLIGMLLTGVAAYVWIPQEFVNINKYHAMTRGVLMESNDPEAALQAFGIDKQFAVLNKSIYYEPYTTVDVNSEILEKHFYNEYGFGSILLYYLTHPEQAGKMLDLAAQNAFKIRPTAMGNYEKTVEKPFGAQTSFFSGYSLLKETITPKTFGFIGLWMILVIGLYMPSFISAIKARNMRAALRLPLIIMMILAGLSGIVASIIGAGDADLAKHEFLFTAAFDMVSYLTIADVIRRQLWQSELEGEA